MTATKRGVFIVIEGIDASGSTTQTERLAGYLKEDGSKVLQTREPSDGPAGMLIRLALARRLSGPNWIPDHQEVVAPAFSPLDVHALALLFAADRRDHVSTRIEPALERGHHVVCDRFTLSSLAYQGLHVDMEWILSINRHAGVPDLTIFLDVPAINADLRIRYSRLQRDDFERLDLQERVQRKYREAIAHGHPGLGRIEVVDASRPVGTVWKMVKQLVDEVLEKDQEKHADLVLF
jgi:dTMP kinase